MNGDGMQQDGDGHAPAGQRGDEGGQQDPEPVSRKPWQRRRERWGKLSREARCTACGRCLWVNWTRQRPCMWCDESAEKWKGQ